MYKFGFIGTGNMGGTIARAVCKTINSNEIILSDRAMDKAKELADELGAAYGTNEDVIKNSKYVFLGVKPQMMADMLDSIKDILSIRKEEIILVTMAAGLTTECIQDMAGGDYAVIRIMPNTPALVGMGTVVYCADKNITEEEKKEFENAISKAGIVDEIDERLIDAASAVSGCGPAYVYIFIEALADGAVKCGLPRAKAMEYAAQTVAGAAMMVKVTGQHPAKLKDDVCSPGGTTIEGVHALERNGFRGGVIDAVEEAYLKNKRL
ncbi:MAG: pyrroline-5-carboxylate reductase [Bacillota bacterium]|nr:pyrroline-5-carboxylate reductase [Bacillota bacterium]